MSEPIYSPIDVAVPVNVDEIDPQLRTMIGVTYQGMTQAPGMVVIITAETPSYALWQRVRALVLNGHGGLVLATNKPQITANDADTANIVCNSPIIAADTTLEFTVTFTGRMLGTDYVNGEYAVGTAAVESGVVTLTFKTDFAGVYRVSLKRTAPGATEFGSIKITAVE